MALYGRFHRHPQLQYLSSEPPRNIDNTYQRLDQDAYEYSRSTSRLGLVLAAGYARRQYLKSQASHALHKPLRSIFILVSATSLNKALTRGTVKAPSTK
jgi:hypothetical protein